MVTKTEHDPVRIVQVHRNAECGNEVKDKVHIECQSLKMIQYLRDRLDRNSEIFFESKHSG